MSSSQPKVRIENLIKIYGDNPQEALKMFRNGADRSTILEQTGNVLGVADVTFDVMEGELFVIMGLSGSGKSTLVRCINRLINPTSGHIFIDDEDVAHVDKARLREIRRTKVSMVFQRFGLFPHKSVLDNVEYGLKMRGIETQERQDKAMETLEVVGLAEWANYLPSSLSGGMQQRVGLARALATDAPILLMDEAFSALDPLIRRGMQDELIRLQDELHKTIIFISHDIQESLKIGDRVAIMKDGYVVQIGTPEDIVTNPVDDYIREFTLDVNRAQVLRTGSIVKQTIPFILGQDSALSALEDMRAQENDTLYVVNHESKPVGLLERKRLEQAIQNGHQDVTQIMETDFPVVHSSNTLEDIFHVAQTNVPMAVVNRQGKFKGIVEPCDILSSIGRLTKTGESRLEEIEPTTSPSKVAV